ncbi:MAG: hypothetical protein M5E90_02845 [Asgard group archaeon]|nr:hypothetical protein [Asgard group archaeon]
MNQQQQKKINEFDWLRLFYLAPKIIINTKKDTHSEREHRTEKKKFFFLSLLVVDFDCSKGL